MDPMDERNDRDRDVIIERDRERTTGSGGLIALIVAVVAIVLIVWFVMVSGNGATTDEGDTGGVTVPTTVVP
jgi:hypothetical protein